MTEPRPAGFPLAEMPEIPEPVAAAAPDEPVAVPAPDLPEPPR
jgi:hypothetical protein